LEVNYISIQEIPLFQPNKMSPLQGLVFQIAMFLLPKYRLSEAGPRNTIFPAIKRIMRKKVIGLFRDEPCKGGILVAEGIGRRFPKPRRGDIFLPVKLRKIFFPGVPSLHPGKPTPGYRKEIK
jgi:hypothetical protein